MARYSNDNDPPDRRTSVWSEFYLGEHDNIDHVMFSNQLPATDIQALMEAGIHEPGPSLESLRRTDKHSDLVRIMEETLNPRELDVMLLVVLGGFPFSRVAQMLGSRSLVKNQVTRAMASARAKMQVALADHPQYARYFE